MKRLNGLLCVIVALMQGAAAIIFTQTSLFTLVVLSKLSAMPPETVTAMTTAQWQSDLVATWEACSDRTPYLILAGLVLIIARNMSDGHLRRQQERLHKPYA